MADFGAVSGVFSNGEGLICDGRGVVFVADVDGKGLGGGGGAIGNSESDLIIFVCFAVAWSARESLGGGIEVEPVWFLSGGVGEGVVILISGGDGVAVWLTFSGGGESFGSYDGSVVDVFDINGDGLRNSGSTITDVDSESVGADF